MRFFAWVTCILLMIMPFRDSRAEGEETIDLSMAKAAILVEPYTGTVLAQKDAKTPYHVAGLSKLPAVLTLAQAIDDGTLDSARRLYTSKAAADVPGPSAFLEENESAQVIDLFKAAAIIGAGDAIMTLGEGVYGSEAIFCENVNATIHLAGGDFAVTTALGSTDQFTASALAQLGCAALESATYLKWSGIRMDHFSHEDGRATELVSANRLLLGYSGCNGLMTGSSAEDGYCGVFTAKRNGMSLVAVVLGAKDASSRYQAASAMLDYGFAAYAAKSYYKAGDPPFATLAVDDGETDSVNVVPQGDVILLIKKQQAVPQGILSLPEELEAPLYTDVSVGKATYSDADGNLLLEVLLYPENDVPRFTLKDAIFRVMRDFLMP